VTSLKNGPKNRKRQKGFGDRPRTLSHLMKEVDVKWLSRFILEEED
jgi:hypothetical protein